MIAFPNAKINLGLNILSRRSDGYHNIESCFYPIPWRDSLEIIPSDQLSLKSYGLKISGNSRHNICLRAYHLIRSDFDIPPVDIHLVKNIPMGGGLGGGSADGTELIKLLNQQFELDLSVKQLESYALQLGCDCPFFVENQPKLVQGRGELSEPLEPYLTGYFLVLINPEIHISTKEAYSKVQSKAQEVGIKEILRKPIAEWKKNLVNDFEKSIFYDYPKIDALKEILYKKRALYASMTGSGSTVYGIFKEEPDPDLGHIFQL